MSEPQPNPQKATEKERELPRSREAEEVVLAMMLQWPDQAITPVIEAGIAEEDFLSPRYRAFFAAIMERYYAGIPVTALTVFRRLWELKQIAAGDGPYELMDLQTHAASMLELKFWLDVLVDTSDQRRVISTAQKLTETAYVEGVDTVSAAEQFVAIQESRKRREQPGPRLASSAARDALELIEKRMRGELTGIKTGLWPLDAQMNGLKPNSYFVIAARPSIGKTSLGMQIAWNVTCQGVAVGIISLETTAATLMQRLMSSISGVPLCMFGQMSAKRDLPKLENAVRLIKEREQLFWIHDPGAMDCDQFRHYARVLVAKRHCKVIMIDYLQLLRPATRMGSNSEYDQVCEASRTLKELSQDLPATFLVISQLKRLGGKAPTMEDGRSSGQIEQDATEMVLLSDGEGASDDAPDVKINARIAKQKEGARGDVTLDFNRPTFSFSAPSNP